MRACFCCNVFAMYFMWCICSTPKQARIQNRYLLLVPQAIPVFDPWQTEQQMIEAGNSYRQGIVIGQGMSDRHVSTHSWAGKNLLRYWIHSKRTRPKKNWAPHNAVALMVRSSVSRVLIRQVLTADSLLLCVDCWHKSKILADLKPIEICSRWIAFTSWKTYIYFTEGNFPSFATCSIQITTCIKFGHLSNYNVFNVLSVLKCLPAWN